MPGQLENRGKRRLSVVPGRNGDPVVSWGVSAVAGFSSLLRNRVFRLTVVYLAWALLHVKIFLNLYEMAREWSIYYVAFAAPIFSWHGAVLYYKGLRAECRGVDVKRLFLGVGLFLCYMAMESRPLVAALFSVGSLLALRTSVTGESWRRCVSAGGMSLLLMLPWPLGLLENASNVLGRLYAGTAPLAIVALTGMPIEVLGDKFLAGSGAAIGIVRECSGLQSMAGLGLFATYFSNLRQLDWTVQLLTSFWAVSLAVLLNLVRVLFSCVFIIARDSFWAAPAGHELLGMILTVLGLLLVRALARDIVVLRDEPEIEGSKRFLNPLGTVAERTRCLPT